jgi:hypothetical protein
LNIKNRILLDIKIILWSYTVYFYKIWNPSSQYSCIFIRLSDLILHFAQIFWIHASDTAQVMHENMPNLAWSQILPPNVPGLLDIIRNCFLFWPCVSIAWKDLVLTGNVDLKFRLQVTIFESIVKTVCDDTSAIEKKFRRAIVVGLNSTFHRVPDHRQIFNQ